jgi:hypothetical protein
MKKITLTLAALAISSAALASAGSAHQETTSNEVVVQSVSRGGLRVDWVESGGDFTRYDLRPGELRVYRAGQPIPIQVIKDKAQVPQPEIRLVLEDLTGDKLPDLRVANHLGGEGLPTSDTVYIWAPKQNRFVKSETLSDNGDISPDLHRPGCVTLKQKCPQVAWREAELCFVQKSGLWKTVHDSGCVGIEGPDGE